MEFRKCSLEHGEQNKIGTWITEQDWNMDNRTRLEHGQQNKIGTWTTEEDWNMDYRTSLKHEKQIMFVTRIPEQV